MNSRMVEEMRKLGNHLRRGKMVGVDQISRVGGNKRVGGEESEVKIASYTQRVAKDDKNISGNSGTLNREYNGSIAVDMR